MAEKGGKGFSLPTKAAKSLLKHTPPSDASLKGKDSSSIKSKKGKKVQFSAEAEGNISFLSKSGGRPETATYKGDWGKGGKLGSNAKTAVAKEPRPLEFSIEQELPKNVKCQCLMDCEAAHILQGIQEQMVVLSADPTIKIPVSFDRGLQYARRGSHYTNPQSVRKVLETLKKHGVTDGEICVIANVCPETVEEVFALVPSLKAKRTKLTEPLKDVLSELVKLKQSS